MSHSVKCNEHSRCSRLTSKKKVRQKKLDRMPFKLSRLFSLQKQDLWMTKKVRDKYTEEKNPVANWRKDVEEINLAIHS